MTANTNLKDAKEAWAQALATAIVNQEEAQSKYGAATVPITRRIAAALMPKTTTEVSDIVKIAARYRIPLYPISTGNNWGYGSANPVTDDCVIVDLSQMNNIVQFDPELGVVILQPGVTQQQLYDYLIENNLPFLVPVTGAGPTCSLIGNALERGYGITPYADHFGAVTSIEAIMADGNLYRSPLSELGGREVDPLYKWGIGPYVDGLFSQGNLGIVTQMSIALARKPDIVEAFFFSVATEKEFEKVVHAVRNILQKTTGMTGSINLMNMRRVMAMMIPYPAEIDKGIIPPEMLEALAKKHQVTAWTGAGAIYGDAALVRATKSIIQKVLHPHVARLNFVKSENIRRIKRLFHLIPGVRNSRYTAMLTKMEQTLDIMHGCPNEIALPLAYWKSGIASERTRNPAHDGCGLIWYSPLVPMKADRVKTFVDMVTEICAAHEIEPLITLTSLSERCFDSTVPLLYERSNPEAATNAIECYNELYKTGKAHGFVPYRMGAHSMQLATSQPCPYWQTVLAIKHAVDPDNIISPGRYSPT